MQVCEIMYIQDRTYRSSLCAEKKYFVYTYEEIEIHIDCSLASRIIYWLVPILLYSKSKTWNSHPSFLRNHCMGVFCCFFEYNDLRCGYRTIKKKEIILPIASGLYRGTTRNR